jgi:hypothetical protein
VSRRREAAHRDDDEHGPDHVVQHIEAFDPQLQQEQEHTSERQTGRRAHLVHRCPRRPRTELAARLDGTVVGGEVPTPG